MVAVKFFAVRLFLGEEETLLHLKGHKALTKKMVKETILDRWPSAEIDYIRRSSRAPFYRGNYGYLTFDKVELQEEQPVDWIYGKEASYDADDNEMLSGRQFRLPNSIYFELMSRARRIERKNALNGRKRLSKEVVDFLRDKRLSIDDLKDCQYELRAPSLEETVRQLTAR